MSESTVDVLLIGGGIASATAAAELRKQGFGGSITLVTRELEPPYHRPAVTKELLRVDGGRHGIAVHPDRWWAEHEVGLLTRSAVMALDTGAHSVTLANKTVLGYGKALLATGAMVRRLPVGGAALEGIHYLRAPGNARKLRAELSRARRAVLVGGSFVAAESAASLTARGVHCTMIMPESGPLVTTFGRTVSDYVAGVLREHGVELRCGDEVVEFTGEGLVSGVRTGSGEYLPADVVVVGIGAVPDTKLGAKAGLALGDTGGFACDATLRTSADDVFAAGDVCEYDSVVHGRRLRVEHEEHAAAQGATAALGLLGRPTAHTEVPYFWTDLADWASLEYVGPAAAWDRETVTGSVHDGRFTVWYCLGDRVVAALASGRSEDLDLAREFIASPGRTAGDLERALRRPDSGGGHH